TPDGIDKQLKDALPFSLPLEDRRQIRAVTITLHQAFTFDLLSETYIANNRTSLPAHPADLNEATKNIFPITIQDGLKKLGQHKRSLQ
ncbi:16374_t:CDS:1, partial [Gigaspora rosea]